MQPASSPTLLGSILCISLSACAPPDTVEIEASRIDANGGSQVVVGATSEARFGGSMGHPPAQSTSSAPGEAPLDWDVPAGWDELPKSEMRIANLRPAGHPEAECSLIILPGDGGGIGPNLNRWCGQMGLPDLDSAAIAALGKVPILGMPATELKIEGEYSGMGDTGKPGFGLHGVVLPTEAFTVFVKMTGPVEVVAAEGERFLQFCASIRGTGGEEHSADDGHDHSTHAPGAHGEEEAPPIAEPETVAGVGGPSYVVPVGWRNVGPDGMRSVNLTVGEDTQCYLIELGGSAGGELPNLNRWRSEVGLDPMSEADLADLERIEFLGQACPLLDVTGEYSGMGGSGGKGRRVLATLLIRDSSSVFVKMVGPEAEVSGEREAFIALCASFELPE